MIRLHKRGKTISINVEPDEGERSLLCSNESGIRFPSLDFLDTSSDNVSEDMLLDYLAQIISEIYLQEMYANGTEEESSNLLPCLNKGTS